MYRFYTRKLGEVNPRVKKILRIMRLTTVILLAAFLQVSASVSAQKVTLVRQNVSLREMFREISRQTGYNIIWTTKDLPKVQHLDMNYVDAPLETVLRQSLSGLPLNFSISQGTIVIMRERKSIAQKIMDQLSSIEVGGFLTDEKGLPLGGATIMVKGSTKHTTSNPNGYFNLTEVPEDAVIVIAYIGFQTKEFAAKKDLGTIRMQLADSKLDEVQVQAYGETSRRLNTGNIGTVKAVEIEKQPVINPLLAIQGRIPGVFITQASGLPNSTVSVRIRGLNTIDQQKEPLYIIDGLPYASSMLLNVGTSGSGQASPLAFLNISTIESIDVLKDADATAIYGSRGANGVVIITTKTGKSGTAKFDLNTYTGISRIPRKLDLMSTEEYLQMRREAFANDGLTPGAGALDLIQWDPSRDIDWQERLIGNNTINTDVQLALSGGTEFTQYRAFAGYNRISPPFPGDFRSQKVSGGINLNTTSTNRKLRIQLGLNYLSDNSFLPQYDPTGGLNLAPNAPEPLNPDGSLNFTDFSNNPLAGFKNWYRGKTNNLIANAALSYNIYRGLSFKVSGGYNTTTVNGIGASTIAERAGNPLYSNPTGTANFSNNNVYSWIAEPQLSYNGFFAAGKWNFLLGSTFQEGRSNGQLTTGRGYTNDALLGSLAASSSISNDGSTAEQNKFTSVYARINYDIKNKYILNLTGRRDGSSRFGPGRKFGNFGAAGAAWVFSNETFVSRHLPFLSFGKIRASYGVTGNEPAGNYNYLSLNTFLNPSRPYQDASAIAPDNLLAPDYAWEQVKKAEAGLELGFLKDRILASVSVFKSSSSNQLVSYTLPTTTGFTSVTENRNAVIENSGVELSISSTIVKSGGFSWKTDANLTIARNKLASFPDIERTPYQYSMVVGLPLTTQRYYRSAGVDPQTGLYQFFAKDGSLTSAPDYLEDATEQISMDPKYFGGLQNSFTVGSFTLDVFLQFVKQMGTNYLFASSNAPGQFSQGFANQPRELLQRWQKAGDIAPYQRFTSTFSEAVDALSFQQYSDAAIVDASYIRLKNVSLSYQLPAQLTKKVNIETARFFLHAQNLYTFTPYKGLDPESQTYLPPLSTWTLGAQLTF